MNKNEKGSEEDGEEEEKEEKRRKEDEPTEEEGKVSTVALKSLFQHASNKICNRRAQPVADPMQAGNDSSGKETAALRCFLLCFDDHEKQDMCFIDGPVTGLIFVEPSPYANVIVYNGDVNPKNEHHHL